MRSKAKARNEQQQQHQDKSHRQQQNENSGVSSVLTSECEISLPHVATNPTTSAALRVILTTIVIIIIMPSSSALPSSSSSSSSSSASIASQAFSQQGCFSLRVVEFVLHSQQLTAFKDLHGQNLGDLDVQVPARGSRTFSAISNINMEVGWVRLGRLCPAVRRTVRFGARPPHSSAGTGPLGPAA